MVSYQQFYNLHLEDEEQQPSLSPEPESKFQKRSAAIDENGGITVTINDKAYLVDKDKVIKRAEQLELVEMRNQDQFRFIMAVSKLSRSEDPIDYAVAAAFKQIDGYYQGILHKGNF